MYFDGDHMGAWGWAVMTIGMVAFWALVITCIVLLVRSVGQSGRQQGQPQTSHTPEQVLAERFARGEIDDAEYQNRLAILREHVRS